MPREWLLVGAYFLGASLVVGYKEDQRSAREVLLKKVNLPDEVMIQDFVPAIHTNMINEARLLGEIDETQSIVLNLGSSETPAWVMAQPIFPVEAEAMPFATQRLSNATGGGRRPMPRDNAAKLAAEREAIGTIERHALAYSIRPVADVSDTEDTHFAKGHEIVSELDGKLLASISGSIVSGSALRERVVKAFDEKGIQSAPGVMILEPTELVSSGTWSKETTQAVRKWLMSGGVLLALLALVLPYLRDRNRNRAPDAADVKPVRASANFPAVEFFQPIATQDELAQEDAERRNDERRKTSRRISQLAGSALSTLSDRPRIRSQR